MIQPQGFVFESANGNIMPRQRNKFLKTLQLCSQIHFFTIHGRICFKLIEYNLSIKRNFILFSSKEKFIDVEDI